MTIRALWAVSGWRCWHWKSNLSEDSLLAAMERAGAEDMGDDVERKGLGTPATRADVIEKLVRDGFVKREKKQMIPTEDGVKLITILPDVVKSPKLTADWENALILVSKGEYSMQEFMGGIEDMVKGLVQTYHCISDEQKSMFGGSYDAYFIPEGIEDYSYTKDGKEIKGSQYKVKSEFSKKK